MICHCFGKITNLKECHKYHEEFLINEDSEFKAKQILVLNGNNNIYESNDVLTNWIQKINEFIDL